MATSLNRHMGPPLPYMQTENIDLAISLYTSGNIELATSLYLTVHRMAAELPIEHSTYTLLLFVVVFVYRAAVQLVINKQRIFLNK